MAKRNTKSKSRKKQAKTRLLHKKRVHLLFGLFFVSIFVAGALVFTSMQPLHYREMKVVSSKDNSFHLQVPAVMSESFSGDNVIDFEHRQLNEGQGVLSHIRVQSYYVQPSKLKKQKIKIRQEIINKSGSFFQAFAARPLTNPNSSDLEFGDFRQFSNEHFKEGVLGDFSYMYEGSVVTGNLLITFGDDSIYILTIEAIDDVWQSNQATWQQVIESFSE